MSLFSFKRLGIFTADDQKAHIMPRHKYIYISDMRVVKLCPFCTLVHVLNYWSFFQSILPLLANGFARQITHFGDAISVQKKAWDNGKKMTFSACLISYVISIIHNYKLKSHHSSTLRPR